MILVLPHHCHCHSYSLHFTHNYFYPFCLLSSTLFLQTQIHIHARTHSLNTVPRLDGFRVHLAWEFVWGEGFSVNNRETKSNSLYFDWASILWSMGAQESMKGAKVTRDTDEGIRIACKHFQVAAGIFEFIQTMILPNFPSDVPQLTISKTSLQLAKNLMLAQGQMCFYEKAVKDKKAGKMKPAVIAKLSAQTAFFYSEANRFCMDVVLGRVIDPSWRLHTEFQYRQLEACSEYWQALAVKEEVVQLFHIYICLSVFRVHFLDDPL